MPKIFEYYCFYAWERQHDFPEDITEDMFDWAIVWC